MTRRLKNRNPLR